MRSLLRYDRRYSRAPTATAGAFLLVLLVGMCAALVLGGCAEGPWGDEPVSGVGDSSADGAPEAEAARAESLRASLSVDSEYTMGPVKGAPLLRVGLARAVSEVSVGCDGAYSVTLFGEKVHEWPSESGGEWRFEATHKGVSGEGPSGSFPPAGGTVRMAPDEGAATLEFEGTRYRGEIEIFSAAPGSLSVANVVDLESYLRGVVPREIGPRPESEIEAVKAQAVAARTYAVASSGKRAGGSFDVWTTVADQVYGGVDAETPVSDRAVMETAGVIAVYVGEPINAYFHANCGGRTEARHEVWELPGLPYLESIWDTPGGSTRLGSAYCFEGAGFTWEEEWSASEIERVVRDNLPGTASTPAPGGVTSVRNLRVSATTPSGRVRWLEVETNLGKHRVFGDRVRWLLRRPDSGRILRSAWFELDVTTSGGRVTRVVARGRGYGHGVGMCQHGALEMAREGYGYEDILRHYYAGIEIAEDYGRRPGRR